MAELGNGRATPAQLARLRSDPESTASLIRDGRFVDIPGTRARARL